MKGLVTTISALAAAAAFAEGVTSSNTVGFDNSYEAGSDNNFCSGAFVAVGFNTVDIQSIQIPGAEWEGVTFAIWEGVPTVRAGSEFAYYDASNDPNGEETKAYWGDEEYNKVSYSIAQAQSFVLNGLNGYNVQFAGEVPTETVEIEGTADNNFLGNPFPVAIDIQAIQIPGAEWEGVTFAVWEGVPTVRAGSEFAYYDASNDPNGEETEAYWGDEEYNKVSYEIAPGEGFVLNGVSGYTVEIHPPFSL